MVESHVHPSLKYPQKVCKSSDRFDVLEARSQDGGSDLQGVSKWCQMGAPGDQNVAPTMPDVAKGRPQWHKGCPRGAQECLKDVHGVPKGAQGVPKGAQKHTKVCPRVSTITKNKKHTNNQTNERKNKRTQGKINERTNKHMNKLT